MKLSELFEDFRVSQSKRDFYSTLDSVEKTKTKTGTRSIGGEAAYARVYDLPKETNSVLKIARHPEGKVEMDGYLSFAKRVMKMDNPYFPKIDELDQKQVDGDGEPFFTVKMEKLNKLTELSNDEIYASLARIFGHDLSDHHRRQFVLQNTKELQRERKDVLQIALATFLEKAIQEDKFMALIHDTELLQALKMLRIFWKNHHYLDVDNHDNIMFRRTPYGAQLVFTDPFSIIKSPEKLKAELEARRAAQQAARVKAKIIQR